MTSSTTWASRTGLAWRTSAVLGAGVLALAACNGDSGAAPADDEPTADGTSSAAADGGDGNVEIRFSWWGSDDRHTLTQEVIDLFEEKNPGITVVPDYTDWGGYWDKLATTVAGGDTPDVMTQEERYLTDYANRGVVADMSALDIDTSKIDETVLAGGTIDGKPGGHRHRHQRLHDRGRPPDVRGRRGRDARRRDLDLGGLQVHQQGDLRRSWRRHVRRPGLRRQRGRLQHLRPPAR
ncbi:hypothetical protein GCM10025876_17880 [Demequina litorisediminis]|uniref:ABC transporter substrate-binding protein YesO n=1 Tax=Demequina litorisediminis TaxID=1849022 RepID=A0ABQ6ID06_9MICO|nr:extracellular solute-binding protein [Demequina litorisediminis]GMA35584.1 hypothetical protein GCM10025876_17880 [Demequina litorisediminis]